MRSEKFAAATSVSTPQVTSTSALSIGNQVQFSNLYTITIRQEAIVSEGRPAIQVRAHMPEEVTVDTSSEYDTPFADGLITDRRIQTLAQLAGWSPTTQGMTAHFWRGSSPIEISLPLVIVAYSSSAEISQTVLLLKSLQVPRKDPSTGFLRAPGPRLELNMEAANAMLSAVKNGGSAVSGLLLDNVIGNDQAQKVPGDTASATDADKSTMDKIATAVKTAGVQVADATKTLIDVKGKISIRIGKFLYFDDVVVRSVSDTYNIVMGDDGRPQRVTVTVNAVTRVTPIYEDLPKIYGISDPIADKMKANGKSQ